MKKALEQVKKVDREIFITLGAVWFIVGIAKPNTGIWIIGLAFFVIGLSIKKKK